MKKTLFLALFTSVTLLAGCGTHNPYVVSNNSAGQLQTIQYATVLSVRSVTIDGNQTGLGAITGGAIGAIAGSGMGGGRGSTIAGIVGGVAAATVGNAIERASTSEDGQEILLKLENGVVKSIVQGKAGDQAPIVAGQRVILVQDGTRYRVVPAN